MALSMKEAYRATAPHSFAYVISRDAANRVNVMGVSWWTFVSSDPAALLICLSKKKHTLSNIQATREFSLCIPDESLRDQARSICATSGKDVDKVKAFQVELKDAQQISAPVLEKALISLECRLREIVDGGDHAICVADIACYAVDESYRALKTLPVGYAL